MRFTIRESSSRCLSDGYCHTRNARAVAESDGCAALDVRNALYD